MLATKLARDKHSSLFWRSIETDKKLTNIGSQAKLLSVVLLSGRLSNFQGTNALAYFDTVLKQMKN